MSTTEQELTTTGHSPTVEDFLPERVEGSTLARFSDPKELIKVINKTMALADDDFEDLIHTMGFRVALWTMRKAALEGDLKTVQALGKYLERCDVARSRTITRTAASQDAAASFVQPEREPNEPVT